MEAGRELDRSAFYTTGLTAISILEPGEAPDSPRVRAEVGAMAMASIHYAYDQWRNFGHQAPGVYAEVWDDYTALLAQVPEARRHQRIHWGHNCWVHPEEEKFLTAKILQATCMIGTRDELIERLSGLAAAGLDQVMILPNFDTRYEVLEQVGRELIGHIG